MSSNKKLVLLVVLVSGIWLFAACAPGPDVSLPASTVAPTLPPPPTNVPQPPAPTGTPPVTTPVGDSLARMGALIERGVADGEVEQGGEVLLQTFARVKQALGTSTRQNTNAAKQQLVLMQLQMVQGTGAKTVAPAFGQAVLSSIDSVARDYDLQLPQTFTR